ncbi:hypothetical protein [Marinicrinis sediminis]|uniref:Uncharacterized protein n=1 Tax=Marinicrinis sediminis TaxID=1652465 RepID=A0ABW5RFS2_9BACL
MSNARRKIAIYCRQCGERFILRASEQKGKWNSGFKRCICNNEDQFDVEIQC